MGQRGAPAKPTNLKMLEGNPGRRPLNQNEPKPLVESGEVKPPPFLNAPAKKEWKRIVVELQRLELFTLVDHAALQAYCQSYGKWVEFEKLLKKEGMTFTTPSGYIQQRPEVAMANKALDQMKKFATEFGMTPSSRSRMQIDGAAAKVGKENSFQDFLMRKNS